MEVGETMTFVVKFFRLASVPRTVESVNNFKVEITRNSLTIAHVEEVIQVEENEGNYRSVMYISV